MWSSQNTVIFEILTGDPTANNAWAGISAGARWCATPNNLEEKQTMSDAMRVAFEKWYEGNFDRRPTEVGYETGICWQAWQAALEHAGQGVEPFAYYNPDDLYWIENGGGVTFCGQKTKTFSDPVYAKPPAPVVESSDESSSHKCVPEGWKLVPVEPTDAMLRAAWEQHHCDTDGSLQIYRVMLNAAPNLQTKDQ